MGEDWENFFTWARNEIINKLKNDNLLQETVDLCEFSFNYRHYDYNWFKKYTQHMIGKKSLLRDFLEATTLMEGDAANKSKLMNLRDAYNKMGKALSHDYEPTFKIGELTSEINRTYPLLNVLSSWQQQGDMQATFDYINLIDKRTFDVIVMED
jgi:hypothetical protein